MSRITEWWRSVDWHYYASEHGIDAGYFIVGAAFGWIIGYGVMS